MDEESQDPDFSDIVSTLSNMFGDVMSTDAISAVVESCGGDVNLAVEAIINITNQNVSNPTVQNDGSETNSTIHINEEPLRDQAQEPKVITKSPSLLSYAVASQNTTPDQTINMATQSFQPIPSQGKQWTTQIRKIITFHNEGTRTLVILRGLPGSGKSHLAKDLVDMTVENSFDNYKKHILSTDDYFMLRGQYQFDKSRLSEAHAWNQNRAKEATSEGLSPILIDNTNIELWEMEPYVKQGVKNGYTIEVVEPTTQWSKNLYQLSKRNRHNVPLATIKRMLDNFRDGITGEFLIKLYSLSYPGNMVPPVIRTVPPFIEKQPTKNISEAIAAVVKALPLTNLTISQDQSGPSQNQEQSTSNHELKQSEYLKNPADVVDVIKENVPTSIEHGKNSNKDEDKNQPNFNESANLTEEELKKHTLFVKAQKNLEEVEKVAQEWDNGESWNDDSHKIMSQDSTPLDALPKPSRNNDHLTPSQRLLESVQRCQDWSNISMFMPSWDMPSTSVSSQLSSITVEKTSSSTSMEIGDTDENNIKNLKIILATPRNINNCYVPVMREKIPDKRMLDKSSMTNEQMTVGHRCKNEEKHFINFRNMFKSVARADLRDVFDKCHGDVNWAVNIIFDSVANKSLKMVDDGDLSDLEEDEISEQCDCIAAYNIIPDTESATENMTSRTEINEENATGITIESPSQKKSKRDVTLSDCSLLLKQHIEQQVVISKNHYSQSHLKFKKYLGGDDENNLNQPSTSGNVDIAQLVDTSETALGENNSDDESLGNPEEPEKVVTVNFGREFLMALDGVFGTEFMAYPFKLVPKVSLPMRLLSELFALWVESLVDQLDQLTKQSEMMMKQDEDLARELAMKEAELIKDGKEPAVMGFKEIMDLDIALSMHQKNLDEWRNSEPQDLAAKLSRDKLYNLFPEIEPALLSELLMAHENDFQYTVESLLMSTGRSDILQTKNGVNKFVMEKEMQRQGKLLAEQKKDSLDEEWPLLTKGDEVTMSTVEEFRDQAEKHLQHRDVNHQRAHDFVNRGMIQVAVHYSEMAAFHKRKFEQANSFAAASLIQVHAANNPDNTTIDLHYLRVGEAREALDLFIDSHINKLMENQGPGCARFQALFFITGRGLHSVGGPKIKPAVKKRLRERGIVFRESNPGLLTAKVSVDHKLTYQVQNS